MGSIHSRLASNFHRPSGVSQAPPSTLRQSPLPTIHVTTASPRNDRTPSVPHVTPARTRARNGQYPFPANEISGLAQHPPPRIATTAEELLLVYKHDLTRRIENRQQALQEKDYLNQCLRNAKAIEAKGQQLALDKSSSHVIRKKHALFEHCRRLCLSGSGGKINGSISTSNSSGKLQRSPGRSTVIPFSPQLP